VARAPENAGAPGTAAARELNDQRERWLNPPEWIDPIAQGIDSADSFADVPPQARPLIRQSFIMAAAGRDQRLKKRKWRLNLASIVPEGAYRKERRKVWVSRSTG
jgi:hypothetical protein